MQAETATVNPRFLTSFLAIVEHRFGVGHQQADRHLLVRCEWCGLPQEAHRHRPLAL